VRVDVDGCLEVRGAAVGLSYWPEPRPQLCGGAYRTSDLAELAGGRVFLRGRAGDLINVAGRKVAPETIEKILLTHPAVDECLVFGAPIHDGQRTEIIVACVVSRQSVAGEALRQFLLGKLPTWQVPREWWLVDSLGANDRGKVSRADWRRRFLEINSASENVP
jgi:acyl-coenzyme A synthetase/AMP-(fatty) acid ligase